MNRHQLIRSKPKGKCPNKIPPGSFLRPPAHQPLAKGLCTTAPALPRICGALDSLCINFHTCPTQGHKQQRGKAGIQVEPPSTAATQHLLTPKPLSWALTREATVHSQKVLPSGFAHPGRAKHSPVYKL